MIRRPNVALALASLTAMGAGALACGDSTPAEPPPADSILRYQISMDGFLLLATGDTIPFENLSGELNVAQAFDPTAANGANEVDVGIFTDPAPGVGITGIRFATNTILAGPNVVATSGVDVAEVIAYGAEADVEATLLPEAVGTACTTPPADNIFAADSIYKMLTGRVLVTLPAGAAAGSVVFGGNPCDGTSTASTTLSATFTGSRLQ